VEKDKKGKGAEQFLFRFFLMKIASLVSCTLHKGHEGCIGKSCVQGTFSFKKEKKEVQLDHLSRPKDDDFEAVLLAGRTWGVSVVDSGADASKYPCCRR